MNASLHGEEDALLSIVTVRAGGASGKLSIETISDSDALFAFYFDRGGKIVTLISGDERRGALLETHWDRGARRWFLDTTDASIIRTVPEAANAAVARPAIELPLVSGKGVD